MLVHATRWGILVRLNFPFFTLPLLFIFPHFHTSDRAGPFRTRQIACHYCPAGGKVAAARPFSLRIFPKGKRGKNLLKILNLDASAEHFHSMFLSFCRYRDGIYVRVLEKIYCRPRFIACT